jgi:uncharacterized spore protein YtfJ
MTADIDVKAVLDRVGQNLHVSRAFGQPFERDDTLVIPVAFVAGGGGTNKQPADPKGQEGAGFGGVVYPSGCTWCGRARCASSRAWTQIWSPCLASCS